MRDNNFIIIPKWMIILAYIDKNGGTNTTNITKMLNVTNTHAIKLIRNLQQLQLIEVNKNGGSNSINTTIKGKEFAEYCYKIILLTEENQNEVIQA